MELYRARILEVHQTQNEGKVKGGIYVILVVEFKYEVRLAIESFVI